jgi:hypothetical protein
MAQIQRVHTGSRTHPVSSQMGTVVSFPRGVKVTYHLHMLPRLKERRAIPLFPIRLHVVELN